MYRACTTVRGRFLSQYSISDEVLTKTTTHIKLHTKVCIKKTPQTNQEYLYFLFCFFWKNENNGKKNDDYVFYRNRVLTDLPL